MSVRPRSYQAVVIGASTGGMQALRILLTSLKADFSLPIIVVQHRHSSSDDFLSVWLNERIVLSVSQAKEKEKLMPGHVYFAPPDYHLLVEMDQSLSFSLEGAVNYSRPSVDVLFETAADAYGPGLIGIILTGANYDGSIGLKRIKNAGGYAIVQDPQTAEVSSMPLAALKTADPDKVLPLEEIGPFLQDLVGE